MNACKQIVFGIVALALGVVEMKTADALPAIGSAAPDFALKSNSGQNLRLSELRGRVVLINFWASWCVPCAKELPLLNQLYAHYRAAGFVLLAVNVDTLPKRRDAEDMLQRFKLGFPVLFDPAQTVVARYQEGSDKGAMPLTLIIDRDGRVRYVHRGYYSGYEKTYDQEVRELLKE